MPVRFTGGPSGMRDDYLPPVPDSGQSQPMLKTQTDKRPDSAVYLQAENPKGYKFENAVPTFMPEAAGLPLASPGNVLPILDSTDVIQADIAGIKGNPPAWGPGVKTSPSTYSGPGIKGS